MKRRAFLLCLASLAWAQVPTVGPQIPRYDQLRFPPLRPVELPKVESHTLSNGMRVLLLEDHSLPLASGIALIRTGSLFDPPEKVGLADITGAVLRTGGTSTRTGEQLDRELEDLAASIESSIGDTVGTVSFSCLSENLNQVLQLFKEVLTTPAFRQDKLDLAKTQRRSLIARRNDDPAGIAAREFRQIVYGRNTPYGWRMEYEHLERIQREDLVAFHDRYFFPGNILLAIQGDFAAEQMLQKLETLFGDWKVSRPPVPQFPPVTSQPQPGLFVASKTDINQTFFRIGHVGSTFRDPDYPALSVMADILGGGFSSRLFVKVRTQLGYAYHVSASWNAEYLHPGLFTIAGSTKSESTVDTLRTILAELQRLRSEEVSDEELRVAKDTVLNSFVFNFDQPSKILTRLARYRYYGYPDDFIFQYQKAVAGVTKRDVLEVARKWIRPEQLTIVAVVHPGQLREPLSKLGLPIQEIDLTIPPPRKPEPPGKPAAQSSANPSRVQAAIVAEAARGLLQLPLP